MADDKDKLEGQRAAIREHIDKYNRYNDERDKETALKTIRNCQNQISSILSDHRHWDSSSEDTWRP